MSLNIKKIPVFVFPNTLKFYLASKTTHKQLLTLYNPYDFPVRFKVLCTAPSKYAVTDPEGSIGPRMLVDVVVRHAVPTAANCDAPDKFRISMRDHATQQVLGKRDVEAVLTNGEAESVSNDGDFQSVPCSDRGAADDRSVYSVGSRQPSASGSASTNHFLAVALGVACLAALLLPAQHEAARLSSVPAFLHVSAGFKLFAAYVLGLVTMAALRP